MIIYQASKAKFLDDSDNRNIEDVIESEYVQRTKRYVQQGMFRSWQGSLAAMAKVLRDKDIPDDIGVGVEFGIPQTAKSIDFILTGVSANDEPHAIIVELKQWSTSRISEKDGIIVANRGGRAEREGAHPSYQAWSYAALLAGFNEAVHESNTELLPCAYLHNYKDDGVIRNAHYAAYLEKAPVFLHGEAELNLLRAFIKEHVKSGDAGQLLYRIENGRIRPSKMLADSVARMLRGNREFVLVDDQKVVFETCLAKSAEASSTRKQVVIVQGGPGTGKSVVAINLLVQLIKRGQNARYVSKNAAPRAVYKRKLAGQLRQAQIDALFNGSGSFHGSEANVFDTLVVDEAHRLNEKSGLYANLGENQIMELIRSANCTIFLADDDQVVTLLDIGTTIEIERWARELGAEVTRLDLSSQFRCAGSDGYLAWLDNTLGLKETANVSLHPDEFDFRVVDSPAELHRLIEERNGNNKARVVAGYCWDWNSRRDPDATDISFPEFGYARQWNLDRDGSLWIMAQDSISEVGCIHTCQGLELDYVGVIVGADLVAEEGRIQTRPASRSRMDRSIRGWKRLMKADPEQTSDRLDRIIRNTYRTLMTRGMKGCYVYFVDDAAREHFARALRQDDVTLPEQALQS